MVNSNNAETMDGDTIIANIRIGVRLWNAKFLEMMKNEDTLLFLKKAGNKGTIFVKCSQVLKVKLSKTHTPF